MSRVVSRHQSRLPFPPPRWAPPARQESPARQASPARRARRGSAASPAWLAALRPAAGVIRVAVRLAVRLSVRLAKAALLALALGPAGAAAAQPFGTYVVFSGTGSATAGNGYLTVPDSPALAPGNAITLEGWVSLATPFRTAAAAA
ncbi:MAG: hypothetical protein JOZ15_16260 [Acidobacteria bacterium]|nr:hypothetical protein [Acidobacteriota bacterium]